jgi:hypothetical protein
MCKHESDQRMAGSIEIRDGETIYRDIQMNDSHRYFYRNFNVTTMGQPDKFRKLIINLEPCRGIVYLFVRKTRRCYPNPYSCVDITPGAESRFPGQCDWTHFHSQIDGSRDGAPTFFEVPLSTTKWFLTIFAVEKSSYTLTIIADIGAFPRPGALGRVDARQLRELQVQLSWNAAGFVPEGVTNVKWYWIYSSLLLESDNRTNLAVFLRPTKIMNTVCGLKNNTDKHYSRLDASICNSNGTCNATVDGVITDKRYVFNVIVESERGLMRSYSGIIMRSDWDMVRQAVTDKTLRVVGVVAGSVLAMVVMVYIMMLKLYGG